MYGHYQPRMMGRPGMQPMGRQSFGGQPQPQMGQQPAQLMGQPFQGNGNASVPIGQPQPIYEPSWSAGQSRNVGGLGQAYAAQQGQPQAQPEPFDAQRYAQQNQLANDRFRLSMGAGGAGQAMAGEQPQWMQARNAGFNGGNMPTQPAPGWTPQPLTPMQQQMLSIAPSAATLAEARSLRGGDWRVPGAAPQGIAMGEFNPASMARRIAELRASGGNGLPALQALVGNGGGMRTTSPYQY